MHMSSTIVFWTPFARQDSGDRRKVPGCGAGHGLEVMSLYNHIANKDEILDGVLDLVAAEIDASPVAADWKTALRYSATSAHDALTRPRLP